MPSFFGNFAIADGETTTLQGLSPEGLAGLLIGNESGLSCVVKMGSGYSRSLYPGLIDFFPMPANFTGTVQITSTAMLSNVDSWPSSFVQVDTIGINEKLSGTYPAALPRNTNVGNAINTNVTGSTLVNTGNPAGTPDIIEIANTTSSGDVTTLDNSGNFVNGNAAFPGTVKLDNDKFNTDGAGNVLFGGKLGVAAAGDLIDAETSANTLYIKVRGSSSPSMQFQLPNGTTVADIQASQASSGPSNGNGGGFTCDKVWFAVGGIKAINSGHFSASGTVNHGLGGTPTNVLLCPSLSGSTWTVSAYSFTSTQFSATINSANNTNFYAYR